MIGKRSFLALAAVAVLLLQFADCMSALTPDQQTMQCCGSMPCTPANKSHDCCKTAISGLTPSVLPTARVSLSAPLLAVIEPQLGLEIARFVPVIPQPAEAQQHSPPELYTLYVSLLI
jgi:hypothetical protein